MLSVSPQVVNAPAVPTPVPVQAGQRKLLRSKKGCLTCKAKHSKCDETRPTCKRCATKGLVCGGYPSEARWTFKHLVFEQPQGQAQDLSSSSPIFSVSPSTVAHTPQQRQSPSPQPRRGSLPVTHYDHHQRRARARRVSNASESTVASVPASSMTSELVQTPQSPETSPPGLRHVVFSSKTTTKPFHSAQPSTPPLTTGFLTDYSSAFIVNWFEQVCPAWSGFDSDANWNRRIAIDLWQSSAAVNSALESMSASFLAPRIPSLRQASHRLMSRAAGFIEAELQVVKNQPVLSTIPTGLMFAMFCMGTTTCWVDSHALGLPFFRELRALLQRLNTQQTAFSSRSSAELLGYFNRSMVYCDMLLAVVSDEQKTDLGFDTPSMAAGSESDLVRNDPDILHPWTGVSTLSSQLFSESVRVCRSSRARLRQPMSDEQSCLSATLQDLLQAQSLEEKLLALEFSVETQQVSDTGDLTTPPSHLTMTAEAYRVSALLHLYQTFPELAYQRLPTGAADAGTLPPQDVTLWKDWIVPLALHLVKILEQIPPSSGSRVIQPLLYISAATGLRYGAVEAASPQPQPNLMSSSSLIVDNNSTDWTRTQSKQSLCESDTLTSYIAQLTSAVGAPSPDPHPATSERSLEIRQARCFIQERLGILETSLPPAPIMVAKELVSTIWKSYDNDVGDAMYMVHWIDVMELNNLRSMFG